MLYRSHQVSTLLLLGTLVPHAFAQGLDCSTQPGRFESSARYSTEGSPDDLATGDLNGDGRIDLVVANGVWPGLAVRLGTSDGSFGPQVIYPAGSNAKSVVVADLNEDGHLDAITTKHTAGPGSISVLLGNGDGTLADFVFTPTNENPLSLVVHDFDGDGHLDVATAGAGDDTVSVLLGLGDGTLATMVGYPVGATPVSLAVGDIDGDGDADLISANLDSDDISVLEGIGDGSFLPAVAIPTGDGPSSCEIADMNGDGRPDLVTGNQDSQDLSVLLGNGDGSFQPALDSSYAPGIDAYALAVEDLDGDMHLDVVVVHRTSERAGVMRGLGDGTLLPPTFVEAGQGAQGVHIADFDGDGLRDLGFASSSQDAITIAHGHEDGRFGPLLPLEVGSKPQTVATGDFDNDGLPDLAVANQGVDDEPGNLSILLGLGDGDFAAQTNIPLVGKPNDLLTDDLDGDGELDLLLACEAPSRLLILFGVGDGTFGAPVPHDVWYGATSVAVDDLDGDGILDIAVASDSGNFPTGELAVLFGTGAGAFTTPQALGGVDEPDFVAIGDIDGDGLPDLLVHDFGVAGLVKYLGTGGGAFAPPVTIPATLQMYPNTISFENLDADGSPDLIINEPGHDHVTYLLNDGAGNFGPPSDHDVGENPRHVVVRDFNGDGYIDFATVNYDSFDISVVMANGDGTYRPALTYPTIRSVAHAAAEDFNADGFLDLAVVSIHRDLVQVLLAVPGVEEDSFAPNHACSTAVGIGPGSYPRLALREPAISDYFTISVPDAAVLSVTALHRVSDGDIDLHLYDEDSPTCGDPANSLVSGVSATDDEAISWTNTTGVTRTVTLEVALFDDPSGTDCNAYELIVDVAPPAFGATVCPGDGSLIPCPCGNDSSDPDSGCANATGVGAKLTASGSNLVGSDDAVFHLTQAMPSKTALLVQGESLISAPFRNGILCMGYSTERVQVAFTNTNGAASTSGAFGSLVNLIPGSTRYYQWWYRSSLNSTCGSASNLSNGVIVHWQ